VIRVGLARFTFDDDDLSGDFALQISNGLKYIDLSGMTARHHYMKVLTLFVALDQV
jgi:hypothetical protein